MGGFQLMVSLHQSAVEILCIDSLPLSAFKLLNESLFCVLELLPREFQFLLGLAKLQLQLFNPSTKSLRCDAGFLIHLHLSPPKLVGVEFRLLLQVLASTLQLFSGTDESSGKILIFLAKLPIHLLVFGAFSLERAANLSYFI
mmetsp:Transcript_115484/g.246810  ORF Transcript_115484/g.246810 Transcript_115484/m.246810 type:complete len:143 (+) Transcript_115484:499-927(+)